MPGRTAKIAVASVPAIAVIAVGSAPAGADIQGWRWANTALTLRQGSQSNQVGFWQALLWSNLYCYGPHDGIFGGGTKFVTKVWQQNLLGYSGGDIDGIVGWHTWDDTQNATYSAGGQTYNRLTSSGNGYYAYYGGSASSASLYWQGGSTGKWKFQHWVTDNWFIATNSRNMDSASC